MNSNKLEEIKARIAALQSESEDEITEHDSLMLMASYLSEFERIHKERNIRRNELATTIGISPSYLTQVFRGRKPLNFPTISKLRRALNVRFDVVAKPIYENSFRLPASGVLINTTVINGMFSASKESKPFEVITGGLVESNEQLAS